MIKLLTSIANVFVSKKPVKRSYRGSNIYTYEDFINNCD